jgi:DNA recombination protein RmuC
MITLFGFNAAWPVSVLVVSALLLASTGLITGMKLRLVSRRLVILLAELEEKTASLENQQQKTENLEDALTQSDMVIQQLRQQNTEFRVRGEEREVHAEQQRKLSEEQRQELNALKERHSLTLTELAEVRMAASKERFYQQEKQTIIEQSRIQLKQELELLANNILENNTSKLAATNESQIIQVLQPVREQLQNFQKKVEDVYEKEAQQRFSLASEISKLQSLNERISEDAIALTNALKGGNKIAGNWGEMVLERLLEASGLAKGREFDVQCSLAGADGRRLQPDVIINLPLGKSVIIDSKVSLVGYEKLYNAESEEMKVVALSEHLTSIRNHVKGLSGKKYQQLTVLKTLDFVLLFIPVEGAFISAVQQDTELLTDAYQQNIVIVSPSTLLATLRVIQNLWQQEHQNQNAAEIARQAGSLYDKFANFGQDLLAIGQRLEQSQSAYQLAIERLSGGRGNLLSRVEKLKTLGARTSKNIPAELSAISQETEKSKKYIR